MMKKIVLFIASCFVLTSSFAFEGVIEQVYTDVNTQEQKTFVWYIQNDKIRLDIKSGEESMTIIPDFKAMSLILFGYQADDNGDHWYSNSPLSTIEVKAPQMRLLESSESEFNGKPAKELKLMSSNGLVVVQYFQDLSFNMKNMSMVFAESMEFNAISLANDAGFPLSSMVMNEKEALYTLKTNYITPKTLGSDVFNVPSGYKLFTGIK